MLKKFMFGLVVSSACFLSSQDGKAVKQRPDLPDERPSPLTSRFIPQSPMKGGVGKNSYWQKKVLKRPDLYRFESGVLTFSVALVQNPSLGDASDEDF